MSKWLIGLVHQWLGMAWLAGMLWPWAAVDAQQLPASFFIAAPSFSSTDRYVATSVFHWYTPADGQLSGPWRPAEGRTAWSGEVPFWQRQIKDLMDANIDVLYLHLIPAFEAQRVNLFTAAAQLRAQGYDVPRIAPFLDPLITWDGTSVDLATTAGKDAFANQYIRFFNQYFSVNTDPVAASYLAQIDGKIVLDTWHCIEGTTNHVASLSRADLESRLASALADRQPVFSQGIYMVGTTIFTPPPFCDEVMWQFSNTKYYSTNTFISPHVNNVLSPIQWQR